MAGHGDSAASFALAMCFPIGSGLVGNLPGPQAPRRVQPLFRPGPRADTDPSDQGREDVGPGLPDLNVEHDTDFIRIGTGARGDGEREERAAGCLSGRQLLHSRDQV